MWYRFKNVDIEELERLKAKCTKLQTEINYFNLSVKSFKRCEKMLTYYTGLESIAVFNLILDSIKPGLKSKNKRLTEFQKLLLCLMKLRLNLPLTDLGFRFNITCSNASIIFRKVIFLLEHMFKNLIYWPEREALRTNIIFYCVWKFSCCYYWLLWNCYWETIQFKCNSTNMVIL